MFCGILYTDILYYVTLFVNLFKYTKISLGGLDMAKVWILDNEGLNHTKEISIYESENVEYKITTKATYEEDLASFGQYANAVVAQVGFAVTNDLIEQLHH